ncbi:MAG: NUDIX hydrolase [Candidatus Obscuribacterales bacterium]|nr:NUDIX hydrolase [Candidatus Obscuribacterales bacterium]
MKLFMFLTCLLSALFGLMALLQFFATYLRQQALSMRVSDDTDQAGAAPAGIVEVPVEQLSERNGAFLAMFCRDVRPYTGYDRPIDCPQDQSFAYILMQLRWDSLFGFPGGKVDPGETPRQACLREAREEVGVNIDVDKLIPLCTHMHEAGNFAAHLYALEVDAKTMQDAIRSSLTAQDALAEVSGVIALRVSLHGHEQGRGIAHFISQAPMSFSARQEVLLIIERLKLLNDEELRTVRETVA